MVTIEKANQVASVCFAPSQWAHVKKLAYEMDTTQSAIVRDALTLYFAKLARSKKNL